MTVDITPAKAGPYNGNGSTTSFPYEFRILDETHLNVFLTNSDGVAQPSLEVGVDYSVSGVNDNDGGAVTYPLSGSPLPTGWKLTILREMPFSQKEDISNNGAFYPEIHEMAWDKLTMQTQQLKEAVDRSVKVDASSSTDPDDLITELLSARNDAVAAASGAATSEANAASSEAGAESAAATAQATLDSISAIVDGVMFRDVVFITVANSPYTVTQAQSGKMIAVDTSGGAVSITLPTISGLNLPYTLGIKKTSADGNAITVTRSGSDLIDGATSKAISTPNSGATFIPDTDPTPDTWTTAEFGGVAGNMTLDTFTGNGSQTVFTLSVAPGSANNVAWYEGGVRQKPGTDYTVSGATLTRTTAPLNLVPIFALSGSTLSIGTPSDATVTNAKMVAAPAYTIKMNNTAGSATPIDGTIAQASAMLGLGGCGQCRLDFVSTTQLKLSRNNGLWLTINGLPYLIPSAGVTLANTGLAANTVYYIYAYMNSGTMTLEASTTARATDSASGMQIKNGDATRTFVGLAVTGAGTPGVFQAQGVGTLSWFNKRPTAITVSTAADRTIAPAVNVYAEFSSSERVSFATFSTEMVDAAYQGAVTCTTGTGVSCGAGIGIDSTTINSGNVSSSYIFNFTIPQAIVTRAISAVLSEGSHYATSLGLIYSASGSPNVISKQGSLTTVVVQG